MARQIEYEFIRGGDENSVVEIKYVNGGWLTVADSASLAAIDITRGGDGQIAYVKEDGKFYIATKVDAQPDFSTFPPGEIPAVWQWTELAFSGSFSGSFQGDGSQLTGIASSLYLTGSVGSDTINLKDNALTLTGSAGGIIVTVTDNKATFTIASPATISGSFTGDGSGLTGVGGVAGGTAGQLQYNSASAFEGANIYYSSSGNLGIGTSAPTSKLYVVGDTVITGTLTAQEFHTTFVSASIIYQSGSTKFGNSADDIHSFTGSVNILGAVRATNYSGSFSGSFQGDGSGLTGIASTLALSGSTGNDLVNLKTEALTLTGSARNIDVAVTNNKATFDVSDNLQLSNVELTGSFRGAFAGTFSGSIDAVITNALTASYVVNAISASYASTAVTASYVAGYVRDGGGVKDEIALWINGDTISGSQGLTYATASNTLTAVNIITQRASGSFSGSFQGDGSQLTGIATSLYISGSTGNDIVDLKANALTITGSARGIIATVTDNTVTLTISNNAVLSGSFSGSYQGSIDNAVSASHAERADDAISSSYAVTASYAVFATTAATASYVAGYAQGSGVAYEVAYWKDGVTVSGSQAFFVSESYSGDMSVFVDGKVYSQNDGGLVSLGTADNSGSKPEVGVYNDTGGGKGVLYAGSSSGVTTGAIQIANSQLMNAYAIGTGIVPNKANTLRIQPAVEFSTGATGSFTGSFYGLFYGLINSASHAERADDAISSSYALSSSYAITASYAANATTTITAATASYFTGSWIDFTPLADANAPAYRNGRLWYGAEDGALNFYNEEADITLQIGQEFYKRVFNASSASINNGTPVRISGSQGDMPLVWPAVAEDVTAANYDPYLNKIIGIATHTIENNSVGYVTEKGVVRGINTSVYAAGDKLYLQTGSAGFRSTPPPFPYSIIQAGTVARSLSNGFIEVDTISPVSFNIITGLSGSVAVNHDLWVYDGTKKAWYNTHSGLSLSGSFSGSFAGTIDRAVSSSHAVQADNAKNAVTASYALKAESVGTLNQDVIITGGLTVYGSSSFYHVTSSQLDVDAAFISVNVFEPAERFGGLRVYDSGSSDATASFAWDSLHNHWVYQNSSGSTYSGGMFLSGPRNTGSLGDEPGLTKWYIARSDGGDHLNDTQFYSSASTHIAYGDLFTTGTTSGSFVGDGSGLFGVAANPAGVDKSIQFKSGSVTGGASNFFYDHTTARVGIGTASPVSALEVAGVVTTKGHTVVGNYASFASLPDAGVYGANVSFDDGFGALLIASRTDAARAIAFGTNNGTAMGERMRIKADGNVGIGTTNPGTKLAVNVSSQDDGYFLYSNATEIGSLRRGVIGSTVVASLDGASGRPINVGGQVNTDVILANAGGNVGIGTTSPEQLLHVNGRNSIKIGYGEEYLQLTNADGYTRIDAYEDTGDANNGYGRIEFRNNGNKSTGLANGGYHFIADSGSVDTSLVRILNNGSVGVGTTSPLQKLDVRGSIILGTNAEYIYSRTTTGDNIRMLGINGSNVAYVGPIDPGPSSAHFNASATSTEAHIYTSGSIKMTVSPTGGVKLNSYGSGTQTGTATKSLAVDSSGNVIEIDVSSNGTGVANEVAFWKDTDTVSGSQALTWDGTTLSINGVLEANEKSFVIDHPLYPNKKLVYGVLEGPEHAVYCRGKISGNVIELPEEWTGLVDQDSITVQLTSIGKHQNLYVVDIRDNKVFIKNGDLLTSKINAYYYIQGTRKDTKPLQTVRDK